jgi:aspartyl-tRNA(Asn)/glutamyl-tRNA(Gln) amidotransferase subunit A
LSSKAISAWESGAKLLEEKGAIVKEISLPSTCDALPTYYIIALGEAYSNLARYNGTFYGIHKLLGKDSKM